MDLSDTARISESLTGKGARLSPSLRSGQKGGRYKCETASTELGKTFADVIAQRFAVNRLPGQDFFCGFDHGAHLLDGSRFRIGNGFADGGIHFGLGSAGGEIAFDDGKLPGLLVDKVLAAAFGELLDGLFALL